MNFNAHDLICRDKVGKETKAFESLKAELQKGFAAPDSEYMELNADDIIARNNDR